MPAADVIAGLRTALSVVPPWLTSSPSKPANYSPGPTNIPAPDAHDEAFEQRVVSLPQRRLGDPIAVIAGLPCGVPPKPKPKLQPRRPSAPLLDSTWARLRTEPGWLLLPLRAFLGVTFVYAGLQKLTNPDYLDPSSPTSVARQMSLLRHTSPIGGLLTLSTHAPTFVGLLSLSVSWLSDSAPCWAC